MRPLGHRIAIGDLEDGMAALRAAEISSALTAWDAATESWGAARDEGTRHLAAVANTAMAIT